jgi:putative serine protease PepD
MVIAITIAAIVLALASGGIGAWTALALDDDSSPTTSTQTGNSSTTRIVDKSSLAEVAEQVQDSVVSIATGSGEGSGVVLTADGYVLTNNHVVAGARNVRVVFVDGKSAQANVVGTDPRTDLAVVKASGVSGLKAAKFGDSGAIKVGDTVLALGSPLGLQGSVTSGIISAKDRTIRAGSDNSQAGTSISGVLQTDAAINPGNSGGALVNTAGEVIGINTAIARSGDSQGNIGVGFAIPSNKARVAAEQLMRGEKVSHPYLGVSLGSTDDGGAVISSVTASGPAAQAGLQQGDVVTRANGKTIKDSDDLVAVIQAGKVGDKIEITYTRNGQEKTITVTLAEAP